MHKWQVIIMTKEWSKRVLARNLKRYMQESGKSQKEMAEVVGVSAPTFNEWINAKKYPRIDKIQIMADYFGIKKSDLIEEKISDDLQNKNDIATDIVQRLNSDKEFCELVLLINKLDNKQMSSVKNMLSSLVK